LMQTLLKNLLIWHQIIATLTLEQAPVCHLIKKLISLMKITALQNVSQKLAIDKNTCQAF
jgi:hypothetical protein